MWRHRGRYYTVGGGQDDLKGGVFPLLESTNLIDWSHRGKAFRMLDPAYGSDYWAPEVAFINGTFWMYYSVGFGDKGHHLRVATSTDAGGPFVDTGTLLTNPFSCPFAIDASPFQDDDGSWYLFYARDFLTMMPALAPGRGLSSTGFSGKRSSRVSLEWSYGRATPGNGS